MKYTKFTINSNSIKLHLDNGSRIVIDDKDAVEELNQYNLADLIGQDYQPVETVTELVTKHNLTKRGFMKVVAFKLGK